MIKYLLGELTEEEQVEVEDRAFADADYLGALEAAESELIDAYVRGQLSPAERQEFERRFLTSPGRRSKVEFARALARVASESRVAPRPFAWQALLDLMRGWSPGLRLATAAATVIVLVAGSWLVVQNTAMRSRITTLETQRHDLETREQGLRRDLAMQSQKQASRAAPAVPAPVVASLVFVAGLTRAVARVGHLVLDPHAQIAHLEIQLDQRDEYPRFRAELRTRGEEVLTRAGLSKRQTNAGSSVSFDVPASALATGQYELALKGVTDNQSVQDVGYYYFVVERQ
ncbi:MAG TPA: hypothetical protein VH640_07505 [Bryobacteraceae bacterium]|jgi:hypothetical protein